MQTNTTGFPVAFACPNAKKAAERSSKIGIASICGICWTKATVNAVEREPGQITAHFKPKRLRVSVNT